MAFPAKNILCEKSLALALLLYGVWVSLLTIDGISVFLVHATSEHRYRDAVVLYHLNALLSIGAITASLLTFVGSILGWMGSVLAWSFLSMHLLAGAIRNGIRGCIDYASVPTLLNIGIIVGGFCCSAYLLRNFRRHGHPDPKHIRISFVAAAVFLLDEIVLQFYAI